MKKRMPKITGPLPSDLNRNRKPALPSWTKKQIEQFLNRELLAEQKTSKKHALESLKLASKRVRINSDSAREDAADASYWLGQAECISELLYHLVNRLDSEFPDPKGK